MRPTGKMLAVMVVAALVGQLLVAPGWAETAVVTLRVEGMTWGAWAIIATRALEGLKGVRKAEVSFRERKAQVLYEVGLVTVQQMIDALAKQGFTARPEQ